MKDIARKKISKDKDLISLFEFKGTSLWWWMEYWLHFSYVYYDSFSDIIKEVFILDKLIEKERPGRIIYANEGGIMDKAIRIIAMSKGIGLKPINLYFRLNYNNISKKTKLSLIKFYFGLRFFIRKMISGLFSIKDKNKDTILSIYEHNPRKKEYLLPVFEELGEFKKNVVAIDTDRSPEFINFGLIKDKISDKEIRHIFLENYISISDILQINKACKKFRKLWNSLKKEEEFKQIFEFKGYNIWQLAKPQIDCYFNIRLKNHLTNFIGIENAIAAIEPKVAITPVETTDFDKGLFVACQEKNIPTIAIQHGTLINTLRAIHEKEEISLKEIGPEYCPIPTITAVYGDNDRDFLIKEGNYPEKGVVVTGNQRHDVIYNNKNEYDKDEICEEIGLDPKKKIIVFATDLFPSLEDTENLIKDIGKAIKKNEDMQLILKVHPNEKIGLYERIVKENKIEAVVTKYDVFKIIYVCDVLLNIRSAIGLETAILDKPIITIDVPGYSDYTDYVEKGIAVRAKNVTELATSIKSVIYDEKLMRRLGENRKNYVYEHCYKIDGRSSKRIAKLIKEKMLLMEK